METSEALNKAWDNWDRQTRRRDEFISIVPLELKEAVNKCLVERTPMKVEKVLDGSEHREIYFVPSKVSNIYYRRQWAIKVEGDIVDP
jgi:hypothetical protein